MQKHKVVSGDTLDQIADKYYGARSVAPFIAQLNNLPEGDPPKIDEELELPSHLYSMGKTAKDQNRTTIYLNCHKLVSRTQKHLQLNDEQGHPIPGAKYTIFSKGKLFVEGSVDSNGAADIEVPDTDDLTITFSNAE